MILSEAMNYLEQAITMDTEFALAYAGYADACLLAGFWGLLPSKEVMPKAKKAIGSPCGSIHYSPNHMLH